FTEFPKVEFTVEFKNKKPSLNQTLIIRYGVHPSDIGRPKAPDEFKINGFTVLRYEGFSGNSLVDVVWGAEDGYPKGFPLVFMEGEGAASGGTDESFLKNFKARRCFILEYSKDFEEVPFEKARVFVIPISVNVDAGGNDLAEDFHPAYDQPALDGYRSQLLQVGLDFKEDQETEWIRYDSIDKDIFCRDRLKDATIQSLWSYLGGEKINRDNPINYQSMVDRVNSELYFRAQHGTKNTTHPATGSKALPVFEVAFNPHTRPGRDDVITLIDVDPVTGTHSEPESARINYSNAYGGREGGPYTDKDRKTCALIALRSGVSGTYRRSEHTKMEIPKDREDEDILNDLIQQWTVESRDFTRIVKFPSGELPAKTPEAFVLGGNLFGDPSPQPGCIDEVCFKGVQTPHPSLPAFPRFVLARELGVDEEERLYLHTDQLLYNRFLLRDARLDAFQILQSLPSDAGFLQIGSELIAYTDVDWEDGILALAPEGRGLFNTEPGYHGIGEPVRLLNFPLVTVLAGNLSEKAGVVAVADSSDLPMEGALLVEEEMIGYTRNEGEAGLLVMPETSEDETLASRGGMFRGRYGTEPARHLSGTLAYFFPVRYRDRTPYQPGSGGNGSDGSEPASLADPPEAAYFPLSFPAPGAFFHRISWVEEGQGPGAHIEIRARAAQGTDWRAVPGEDTGLFSFRRDEDDRTPCLMNLQGDRLDLRIYTRFETGAFDAIDFLSNAWKYAPVVRAVGVDYIQPSRIVRHEEWK
ncbi:MAG: hypothetical protein KJ645_14295, partial [Planctomycetes bacterium]|nr:hypothetical protein [Planctomycetota bacterium]